MRQSIIYILAVSFLSSLSLTAWATQLATVNGRAVTDKDVQMALGGMNEGQKRNLLKDVNTRRQILGGVVDQEILYQQAEREKMDQDKEYKEAVNAFRKQYMVNRLLMKNIGNKVTESDAKNYYNHHKIEFSTDQVHAQHILVSDEKTARDLLHRAQEPNADFQELAEKHSMDPSAKNNRGDLGFFGRGQFVPEFERAAFDGAAGQIVGPVHTTFGYHIIKIVEKKVGTTLPFADAEPKVKEMLKQHLIRNYVDKLKETAKIQVDEKALERM